MLLVYNCKQIVYMYNFDAFAGGENIDLSLDEKLQQYLCSDISLYIIEN